MESGTRAHGSASLQKTISDTTRPCSELNNMGKPHIGFHHPIRKQPMSRRASNIRIRQVAGYSNIPVNWYESPAQLGDFGHMGRLDVGTPSSALQQSKSSRCTRSSRVTSDTQPCIFPSRIATAKSIGTSWFRSSHGFATRSLVFLCSESQAIAIVKNAAIAAKSEFWNVSRSYLKRWVISAVKLTFSWAPWSILLLVIVRGARAVRPITGGADCWSC
jgi:hypothetical protein